MYPFIDNYYDDRRYELAGAASGIVRGEPSLEIVGDASVKRAVRAFE